MFKPSLETAVAFSHVNATRHLLCKNLKKKILHESVETFLVDHFFLPSTI